jgi:hypothetical protein
LCALRSITASGRLLGTIRITLRGWHMQLVENIIKRTRLYPRLYSMRHLSNLSPLVRRQLRAWRAADNPVPPPDAVKRRAIWSCAKRFGLEVLVETGTYTGGTVATLQCRFHTIYSIELSEILFEQARERFKDARNVHLICGDSGVELKNVLLKLDQPALFWLDGHWCGGLTAQGDSHTPICEELDLILGAAEHRHVIFVDDARLFGVDPAYPSLEELRSVVASKRPDLEFTVVYDIIRITPQKWPLR